MRAIETLTTRAVLQTRTAMHRTSGCHRSLVRVASCLAAIFALSGWLPPSSQQPARAKPERPHVWLLRLSGGGDRDPTVFGDTVAWAGLPDRTGLPTPMEVGSVRHLHPRVVATTWNEAGSTQLSAHWLVWEEAGGLQWWIWAENRRTGRRVLVDSSLREGPAPGELIFPQLSLYGDTLAWSHAICHAACAHTLTGWHTALQLKTLPDGPKRTIAASPYPCSQTWPWLSANLLVWHQEGTCGGVQGSDVWLYDRASGRKRLLTHDHESSEAVTNGRFVAWKVAPSRLDDGRLVLLDLRSDRTQTVEAANAAEPRMTSSILTWEVPIGNTLSALDLSTGRRYVLGRPGNLWGASQGGAGWQHRVVWDEATASKGGNGPIIRYVGVADVP